MKLTNHIAGPTSKIQMALGLLSMFFEDFDPLKKTRIVVEYDPQGITDVSLFTEPDGSETQESPEPQK